MKITINVNDGAVSYKASETVNIQDTLQILSSMILGMMNQVVNQAPDRLKEEVKGDLYDLYNLAASRTLEAFAPELELRPNLTAQAILEAENRIILEDRLNEVAPHT